MPAIPIRAATPSRAAVLARRSASSTVSRESATVAGAVRRACSITRGIAVNRSLPSRNAATATSLAALSTAGAVPPVAQRRVGQPEAGEALRVRPLELERSDRRTGPAARRRIPFAPGKPAHGRSGSRMSGLAKLCHDRAVDVFDHRVHDALRMDEHLDADRAGRRTASCASITSSPLFIMVAESTEILRPIAQFGCAQA